jgi:hypothetical protein
LLALALFCAALNVLILWDYHPRMAGRGDDNPAYYAYRAVTQRQFPGDVHHNKLQIEHACFSSPNWLSWLAILVFRLEPTTCGLILSAIKPWAIVFSVYFLALTLSGRPLASGVTAAIVMSANILPLNLAVYGILLEEPYQSDFGYPLVCVTLALLLRERLWGALLTNVALATVHPPMAFATFGVVLVSVALFRRHYTIRQMAGAVLMGLPILAFGVVPASVAFRAIGAENLGSPQILYEHLNQTVHGMMWERIEWYVLLIGTIKILLMAVPVVVSPSFTWDRKGRATLTVLATLLALVAVGLFAKQCCIWLHDTPWLSIAIRFHQMFLPRLSAIAMILTLALIVPQYCAMIGDASRPWPSRIAAMLLLAFLVDAADPFGLRSSLTFGLILFGAWVGSLTIGALAEQYQNMPGRERLGRVLAIVAGCLLLGSFAYLIYQFPWPPSRRQLLARMLPVLWCVAFMSWPWLVQLVQKIRKRAEASEPVEAARPAYAWRTWLLGIGILASLTWTYWHTANRFDMDWKWLVHIGVVVACPLVIWLAMRQSWVAAAVFFVLACTFELHTVSTAMQLPENAPNRSWYALSQWAKENTDENSSFLMVAEYRARPWTWCAWRTYSERGFVPLFEPAWALVYVPDMRYEEFAKATRAHFEERYPDRKVSEYMQLMDAEDLVWLRDFTGARYAIGKADQALPAPCVFRAEHFAIFDLKDVTAKSSLSP